MAIIIPFPSGSGAKPSNFAGVRSALTKAGLAQKQIDAAIAEIDDLLAPLQRRQPFVFELHEDLQLTPSQRDAIAVAYQEAANQFIEAYKNDLGFAACVIAGLVARSHLTSFEPPTT